MKTYLKSFSVPGCDYEEAFMNNQRMTCYSSYYPFGVFGNKDFDQFEFEPITIFYGGNGSGKSTMLNIIAEKLGIKHQGVFNTTKFMKDYVHRCHVEIGSYGIPNGSRILTSDNVFDYLTDVRYMNMGIDAKREDLFEEYYDRKKPVKLDSMDDYENYKKHVEVMRISTSKFVRKNLLNNVQLGSNGESAIKFFTSQIDENALYLLDEPENSMSPKMQLMLKDYIEASVSGYNCQFVIATHSPFLLSLKNAKIYDLDDIYGREKKWTELENSRTYYEFFKAHSQEFAE